MAGRKAFAAGWIFPDPDRAAEMERAPLRQARLGAAALECLNFSSLVGAAEDGDEAFKRAMPLIAPDPRTNWGVGEASRHLAGSPSVGFPSAAGRAQNPAARLPAALTCAPNAFVRWVFYLSAFTIPFAHLYVPGTGERIGVTRIIQFLMLCDFASQPRACLLLLPISLLLFVT